MSYLILPRRVFNSPLIEYANFNDGSHVNLIRLNKPYANGDAYAVHETTKSPFCSNGLFKTYAKAKIKFELMIQNASYEAKLINRDETGNKNGIENDFYTLLADGIKYKQYPIVCITPYEFEGRVFVRGEISEQCWGRNIPDGWNRATAEDIKNWDER